MVGVPLPIIALIVSAQSSALAYALGNDILGYLLTTVSVILIGCLIYIGDTDG